MAKDLNKTRMRDSRILLGFALVVALLTRPAALSCSGLDETMEVFGFLLLTACAIGRIYSTLFIGGIKREQLVTIGPYAMCRNPLYFYSLLGAAGIGLMSREFTLFLLLTGGFYAIYYGLIRREEEFLSEKFGADFSAFCASTPRLLPNFGKFSAPDEVVFQPRFVNNAVWDAIWWFAAVPVFEVIQYVHDKGILKPFFTLF